MSFSQKVNCAVLAALALSLSACHDDFAPAGKGYGSIAPTVELNTSVSEAQKSRAADAIDVSDLSLTITSQDGTFTKTWPSVSDYTTDTQFNLGEYLVEAKYGDLTKEGFEKPCYYGSQTVTVRENETTPVAITATLANTMVSIVYTDAFKNYMAEWDANLQSAGGQYVYFAPEEKRPAYLAPGKITMNVWLKKPNGKDATLKVAEFNALARHHYHVTVDIENGYGDAELIITFDETLNQEEVHIELSDDLFDAPAPEITGVGIDNGGFLTHIIGDEFTAPLKVNINARGALSEVKMTTTSQSLRAQGWPAEVDLMKADAVMQARLQQLGFDCRGLWKNPDKVAVLDFENVVTHLTEVENMTNAFNIQVVDKLGKTSEPFAFGITAMPLEIAIVEPQALAIGADTWNFALNYNGKGTQGISFSYLNERGTWTPLTVKEITETASATKYNVILNVAPDNKALTVRAETKVKNSEPVTIERFAPAITATVDEKDVWANKATISLGCETIDPAVLAECANVYLADGTKATAKVEDGELLLTGLTPGTEYTLNISLTGNASDVAATVKFTTEAATDIPNGDFEDLEQTLAESNMYQGGEWSVSVGINYQSKLSYTISEPKGWASVNKKTTSGSTRNSWFVVPSTFNTSLTYSSTVPSIKVVGTGGGTETPDSYKNFSIKSGSNAMVVRNVAWDPAGTVPGYWRKTGISSTEYYNHTEPTISRASAGKLFLGSYNYANGTETYNQGVLFSSRPAKLTGWYTYTRDANDAQETGMVEVKVLNGDQVIGTGTAMLQPQSAMTQFNVPITYIAKAPKATRVCVMITSSNHASENQTDETSRIKTSVFNYRYESAKHGATLVVDNLGFIY